ncbi:MAG: DUF3800 domain-containing protein [Candidatus Bilamarchaeum sp.]
MLIYIDGSGDFGLTEKHIEGGSSSDYYCLGVIATKNSYSELSEQVKNLRAKYEKEFSKRLPEEIKYTKMNKNAREYVCSFLRKSQFEMYLLILIKRDDYGKIAKWNKAGISEPILVRELLSHLIEVLFLNPEYKLNTNEKVDIYFDDNLHAEHSKMLERQIRRISNKITIHKPQDSRNNVGVQLADVLAGACFHYMNGQKEPFEMLIDKCKLSEIYLREELGFYKLSHTKFIRK